MNETYNVVEEAATHDGSADSEKESNRQLVKDITSKIKKARDHHKEAFKRMRQDQEMVHQGTSKPQYMNGKKYVANIVQRHVQQRVSSLYAKNPKASYQRRKKRDFKVWDEKVSSLQSALATLQQGVLDPSAMGVLMDYEQGMQRRRMLDGLGETLVTLFQYFTDEQVPSFKLMMKQCVRRAVVTGVGYLKLDYQRSMKRNPSVQMHIDSLQEKLDKIRVLTEDITEGELDADSGEARQLELMIQDLMEQDLVLDQEGIIFGFPQSTALIIDPSCVQLQGFIGANWIAEEHYFEPKEVEEIFGVDLKNAKYTKYARNKAESVRGGGPAYTDSRSTKEPQCCVWEFYDRTTGLRYYLMDGYCDFLEEPDAPNVDLERFFPYYSLVFNAIENEKELFPPSDVRLIKPMQDDHNFAREGLREHRKAARPKYVTPQNAFEDTDIQALKTHQPHHVAQIKGMQPGQKAADFISEVPVAKIDPNLYITTHLLDDVQIVVGAQEANFGSVSKATATETSVAESARMSSLQSNIDDLDDFLSDLARDSGQVMLTELDIETVIEIVGPGAVWPELSAEDIRKEVNLKIEAGSSGRPNKAADLANMERVLPYLIQIPGVDPTWLAKEVLRRLDDRLDLTDAIASGLPSITSLNGMMGQPQGPGMETGTGSSPASQGQQGGNNQEKPAQNQGGPQPGYPTGAPVQ